MLRRRSVGPDHWRWVSSPRWLAFVKVDIHPPTHNRAVRISPELLCGRYKAVMGNCPWVSHEHNGQVWGRACLGSWCPAGNTVPPSHGSRETMTTWLFTHAGSATPFQVRSRRTTPDGAVVTCPRTWLMIVGPSRHWSLYRRPEPSSWGPKKTNKIAAPYCGDSGHDRTGTCGGVLTLEEMLHPPRTAISNITPRTGLPHGRAL